MPLGFDSVPVSIPGPGGVPITPGMIQQGFNIVSSFFGGGGGPKDSEAVIGFDFTTRQFGIGDNNAPGAAGPFAALAAEFSDPAKYNVDALAAQIGERGARRSFWSGPGDVASLVAQLRAFAEPSRVGAQTGTANVSSVAQFSKPTPREDTTKPSAYSAAVEALSSPFTIFGAFILGALALYFFTRR